MGKLRKWLHLLLVICMIAGSTLPYLPTLMLTVQANNEGSSGQTPTAVFYVDGQANEEGATVDGSKNNPFETLAEAYAAIPTENTETVIVICGQVDAEKGFSSSGTSYYLPEHSGKVILTSTYDGIDYSETVNAGLNFNNNTFYLLGNTTFRCIHITSHANIIYADFYELHFAENITMPDTVSYVAKDIYAGTGNKIGKLQKLCSAQHF